MADSVRTRKTRETFRGKSVSKELPYGHRNPGAGAAKAPRSLRREGKRYLSECSDEEIAKFVFGLDLRSLREAAKSKHFQGLKGSITASKNKLEPLIEEIKRQQKIAAQNLNSFDDPVAYSKLCRQADKLQNTVNAAEAELTTILDSTDKWEKIIKDFRVA